MGLSLRLCFGTLNSLCLLSNVAMLHIPAHKGPGLADYEARTDTNDAGGVVGVRIAVTGHNAEGRRVVNSRQPPEEPAAHHPRISERRKLVGDT